MVGMFISLAAGETNRVSVIEIVHTQTHSEELRQIYADKIRNKIYCKVCLGFLI